MGGFVGIASPLSQILEDDKHYELDTLTDMKYEASEVLRQRFIRPKLLALPRNGYKYVPHIDVCNTQVYCCLL